MDFLFTNVPLDETIEICVNELFKSNQTVSVLNKQHMLLLTTKESVNLFDQKYYSQIDGEAMDSLLGPTLANIFLCYHESTWLKTVRKLSNHYIAKGTLITSFRCLKNQNKFHDLLST